MRFCDFLNILHDNLSYTLSQSQFILELFSALCGEENPCKANIKHPFSPALPEGLGNDDPKHRNKLYGKSADYKGLTHTVKEHIRANNNKKTFLNYLENGYKNKVADLCDAFEVTKSIKKDTIFEGIYEQFMEYANNDEDDITFKLKRIFPKDNRPFEKIFNDAIFSYNVEGFLESDPTESLSPHFLDDMKTFVRIIQQSNEDKNTRHTDEKISCKMYEFSETLLKYVEYLKEQMNLVSTENVNNDRYMQERYEMPEAYYTKYEPPKDNKNFRKHSLNYRDRLKTLYAEINLQYQEWLLEYISALRKE